MLDTIQKESNVETKGISKKNLCDVTCPMGYAMNRIAGKWKLVILWHIYDKKVIRYGELKKCVGKITHKMLSNQLKELVNDNIIHKEIYHQVPPKVEYSMSEHGKTLVPIMNLLVEWGEKNQKL